MSATGRGLPCKTPNWPLLLAALLAARTADAQVVAVPPSAAASALGGAAASVTAAPSLVEGHRIVLYDEGMLRPLPAALLLAPPLSVNLAPAPGLRFSPSALASDAKAIAPLQAAVQTFAEGRDAAAPALDALFDGAALSPEIPAHMRTWIYAEQKLLARKVEWSGAGAAGARVSPENNRQDPRYAPERAEVFSVKSYWVPAESMNRHFSASLPANLRGMFTRTEAGREEVRVLVHPESEKAYAAFFAGRRVTPAGDFRATATASSRTLLAWLPGGEKDAFFAKLSLDAEIAGARRGISRTDAAMSVGFTDILAAESDALPDGFSAMPEVIGLSPRALGFGGLGMIIRAVPADALRDGRRVVPLFSLYAPRADGRPPLIVEMIRRSGQTPLAFVRERLLRPFMEQWLALAVERGITMEPHAQNVLVELGPDGLPSGRFLHRDFNGFSIDLAYRRGRGLTLPAGLPFIVDPESDYNSSSHRSRLLVSLVHFRGGLVYNLDEAVRSWIEKGWIADAPAGPRPFHAAAVAEFEAAYARLAGRAADIDGNLEKAERAVLRARKSAGVNSSQPRQRPGR